MASLSNMVTITYYQRFLSFTNEKVVLP